MNLIKCFMTKSTWYKGAINDSKPIGILWHDTASGNPNLCRFVQPYVGDENYDELMQILGKNKYNNDWNHIEHDAGLNCWIGKLADGSIATVQTGEWAKAPWGCGSGSKGSLNGYLFADSLKWMQDHNIKYVKVNTKYWIRQHYIQFEICDDGYKSKEYFEQVYKEACEVTAYFCKLFNIDPMGYNDFGGIQVPTITCHAESHSLKLGGNHGDVYTWFKAMGLPRSMDKVRQDVKSILTNDVSSDDTPTFHEGDVISLTTTKYSSGKSIPSWVFNNTLYYRGMRGDNEIVFSTQKTGAITGVVFKSDVKLVSCSHEPDPEENEIPPIVDNNIENKEPEVIEPPVTEDVPESGAPEVGDNAQDKEVQTENTDTYIENKEEMDNFLIKLLNNIISFIMKFFKK